MWDDLIELVNSHERFLVTTHIHPDGDAVGTEIGLGLFLEQLGKAALLVDADPVPAFFRFLDPDGRLRAYEAERDDPAIAACDAAIVVDAGEPARIGSVAKAIERAGLPVACIDHHPTSKGFGHVDVLVPTAASTASLVLDLIRTMGHTPSQPIAEALFAGLATDTGWFRFSNAGPQAFRDAAELVAAGARPLRVYEAAYESHSAARMRLLGLALADLKTECDGRLVWASITREMFESTGATDAEVDRFVDSLRQVGAAEIIILFREPPEGGTRVSLRAKHDADVAALAARFGGGGHRAAAGITLDTPLHTSIATLLPAARALLNDE